MRTSYHNHEVFQNTHPASDRKELTQVFIYKQIQLS